MTNPRHIMEQAVDWANRWGVYPHPLPTYFRAASGAMAPMGGLSRGLSRVVVARVETRHGLDDLRGLRSSSSRTV